MYKIIVLIGKSASGKDSIIQKLHADFKIPIIISHTTRPKRESELDGCEYWFVSDDYFEQEKEIRLIMFKDADDDGKITGINVPIYIESLLQEIWISPKADAFVAELIKSEMSLKNLNPSIVQMSHI